MRRIRDCRPHEPTWPARGRGVTPAVEGRRSPIRSNSLCRFHVPTAMPKSTSPIVWLAKTCAAPIAKARFLTGGPTRSTIASPAHDNKPVKRPPFSGALATAPSFSGWLSWPIIAGGSALLLAVLVIIVLLLAWVGAREDAARYKAELEKFRPAPSSGPALNEPPADMTLAAFMVQRPPSGATVRVLCRMGTYFNFAYHDSAGTHHSIKLGEPERGKRVFANAWAPKGTATGQRLYDILKDGETHTLVLKLAYAGPRGEAIAPDEEGISILSIASP